MNRFLVSTLRRSAPALRLALGALLLLVLCGSLGACGGSEETAGEGERSSGEEAAGGSGNDAVTGDAAASEGELPTVAFLGDSLTAGYGLEESKAFPALLAERFAEEGLPFRALNAGVSGDTSAGGLSRLDWLLSAQPDVVVVELGPNDGLRGLDLEMTEANLRRIVAGARQADARVLLIGMRIPPNYGPDYAGRFQELFPRLADELDLALVPFLLDGVGGVPELNQADGIHPTAEGQAVAADNVAPHLRPLIEAEWEERGGPPAE